MAKSGWFLAIWGRSGSVFHFQGLSEPPCGNFGVPKWTTNKIRKVKTLFNHLEYHLDTKYCKNLKKCSLYIKPPSWWKNDWDDLPKPPGGKYGILKRPSGKIRKAERLSNHLEYQRDPKYCKNNIKWFRFETTVMIGGPLTRWMLRCIQHYFYRSWPSSAPTNWAPNEISSQALLEK